MADDRAWALIRAASAPSAQPAPGVTRMRLTRSETGSEGLGTGITTFEPGAGLYWHIHLVDESVTVLEGAPTCEVGGSDGAAESHSLTEFDTAFIPARTPHRFFNATGQRARILWSYPAGSVERFRVRPDGTPDGDGA